jgi:hypothetical protein
MANMTNMNSQTDHSRQKDENTGQAGTDPTVVQRAAAGASAISQQQVRKARRQFDEQIAAQRQRVSGRARTLSRALNGAGGMLEEDELVAQCLHFAGEKIEGVAGYVDEFTPAQVAEDLRNVARERPAWFFGGAFVLGLALGRFARSTAGAFSESEEPRARSARQANRRAPAQGRSTRPEASDVRARSESSTRPGVPR